MYLQAHQESLQQTAEAGEAKARPGAASQRRCKQESQESLKQICSG